MFLESLTGVQTAGLLCVALGALVTFVFSRAGARKSPRLGFGLKAAGLGITAAGALMILI